MTLTVAENNQQQV